MHTALTNPAKQRGAALVEFAIALPLLLLLLLATADLGRMLSQYNTLAKSVRDAARYVSGASTNSTGVVTISNTTSTAAKNLAVTGNINGTGSPLLPGLTVSSITIAPAGGGYISVSANYTYASMLGSSLPTFGYGSNISLSRQLKTTVLMRALK